MITVDRTAPVITLNLSPLATSTTLNEIRSYFGQKANACPRCDLTRDGVIGLADMAMLKAIKSGMIVVFPGESYEELGATTSEIGVGVGISGNVNQTIRGRYTITYTATDVAGNIGTKIRTVLVK